MGESILTRRGGAIDLSGTDATVDDVIWGKKFLAQGSENIQTGSLSAVNEGDYYFNPISADDSELRIKAPFPIAITDPDNDMLYLDNPSLASVMGLTSSKIAAGNKVLGITGKSAVVDTESANLEAAKMLSGQKGYSKGTAVNGTIASKMATTYTPSTTAQVIAAGQYLSGAQTIAGDINLASSNILAGKSIFGVGGKSTVVDTEGDTAAAAHILSGYSAHANGVKITGTAVLGKKYASGAVMLDSSNYSIINVPTAFLIGSQQQINTLFALVVPLNDIITASFEPRIIVMTAYPTGDMSSLSKCIKQRSMPNYTWNTLSSYQTGTETADVIYGIGISRPGYTMNAVFSNAGSYLSSKNITIEWAAWE